jgi:hypothetical protein
MAARKNTQVVIETTDNEAVEVESTTTPAVKRQLRVTAVSSDGKRSSRNAPAGIREAGDIFAVEITRTGVPEWSVNWFHTTKTEAAAEAKALPGRVRKGASGDVVKARVIAAEAYFVEVPAV